jgi:hypothetical protein
MACKVLKKRHLDSGTIGICRLSRPSGLRGYLGAERDYAKDLGQKDKEVWNFGNLITSETLGILWVIA